MANEIIMTISDYLGVKLSDILWEGEELTDLDLPDYNDNGINAQQQWNASIVALEKLLAITINKNSNNSSSAIQGIIISSPTPIIQDKELISHLETVIFSPQNLSQMALMPSSYSSSLSSDFSSSFLDIYLDINDSLHQEQFCLVLTKQFSCIVLKTIEGNYHHNSQFLFSFNPEVINNITQLILDKLQQNKHCHYQYLSKLFQDFKPQNPHYKIVSKFSRVLLNNLSMNNKDITSDNNVSVNNRIPRESNSISLKKTPLPPYPEFELLQALTHEIRTPLTTIKTLTKLLLKRTKNIPELIRYLEAIEQECTEQINRMELIFKAVELESKSSIKSSVQLVPTSLEEILSQTIPSWKKQAERRNIILDIIVPQKLPQIVSDPHMLSQILTGLMERFTRNLPSGENFKVLILQAGNQLKLQFLSDSNINYHQAKCLGKLLLFQPDTGSLSLSYDVTKNIFNALGGKLIIKQKPDKGEILTVFLPLGNSNFVNN